MPQLLLCIPLNRLLCFVCGSFLNSYLATYIHDRLLYTLLYKFHVPYLSYAYEEQCHLLTHTALYTKLQWITLSNKLAILYQKMLHLFGTEAYASHDTFTSISHDTFWEGFVFESVKRTGDWRITVSLCKTWKMR